MPVGVIIAHCYPCHCQFWPSKRRQPTNKNEISLNIEWWSIQHADNEPHQLFIHSCSNADKSPFNVFSICSIVADWTGFWLSHIFAANIKHQDKLQSI